MIRTGTTAWGTAPKPPGWRARPGNGARRSSSKRVERENGSTPGWVNRASGDSSTRQHVCLRQSAHLLTVTPCSACATLLAVASKGRGYRALTIDGFEVLIGKGDRDNDALTFGVGQPLDLWLHVAGAPGSHVVVRNPDRLAELPREVLTRAAELAAYHSKARAARGKLDVHVCRVADVRKRRGAPPGEVQLERWDTLRVYARADEGADDHASAKPE
jgi:hypothetical protein